MPKYRVQFELRTEGLDAPPETLTYPPWRIRNRDAWMNLTEILTVEFNAASEDDARDSVKQMYSHPIDIHVTEIEE